MSQSTGQLVNAGLRCYATLDDGTRGDQGKLNYWDVLSEMLTGSTPNATDRFVREYVFCTVVLPSLTRLAGPGSVRYG